MSRRPAVAIARGTSSSRSRALSRSAASAIACPPFASIVATVSRSVPGSLFAVSRLRPVTTTVAPAVAMRCAIARPIPRLLPVTSATLPASEGKSLAFMSGSPLAFARPARAEALGSIHRARDANEEAATRLVGPPRIHPRRRDPRLRRRGLRSCPHPADRPRCRRLRGPAVPALPVEGGALRGGARAADRAPGRQLRGHDAPGPDHGRPRPDALVDVPRLRLREAERARRRRPAADAAEPRGRRGARAPVPPPRLPPRPARARAGAGRRPRGRGPHGGADLRAQRVRLHRPRRHADRGGAAAGEVRRPVRPLEGAPAPRGGEVLRPRPRALGGRARAPRPALIRPLRFPVAPFYHK